MTCAEFHQRKDLVQCSAKGEELLNDKRRADSEISISKNSMHIYDAFVRYCDLLTLAEEYLDAKDLLASARLAQIAARYAYPGHVGLLGSPRLERLLLELGKRISTTTVSGVRRNDKKNSQKILHVLTYGRPIGGDSRFVYRWMQEDHNNQHSVVITTQADLKGIYEVPEDLRQSAVKTGGFLHTLRAPTSNPLDQALELRKLCQEADIVVLHLFPYDIVPVLALAAGCEIAKTLYINLSDHTFWIGASVAHSIVHLRKQCPDFLSTRRGLDPDRSLDLPIPLAHALPSATSVQAKRSLGYTSDVLLLLTIATPFKYSAPGEVDFLELVTPVIEQFPHVVLVAVGPKNEGAWRSAHIQTKGRVVPLGERWDNDLLYAAADIYLDSVPFSSITSLLEAGSRGMPLVGYYSPNSELRLLGPGAPGLDGTMELATDVESYRILLSRLINDAEFRRRSGQRVQTQILSLHTGSNWTDFVHNLYERVEQNNDRGCLVANEDTFVTSLLNTALVHLYGKEPFSLRSLIRQYIGTLPYYSRISVTWQLQSKGFGLYFPNLVPPPIDAMVWAGARWAKRAVQRFLKLL
jgi:hypothetical protein